MKQFKKIRVLIVEDDLSQQAFWGAIVGKCLRQIEIDWAVSGEEAKRLIEESAKRRPYGLVISDLFLAGSETGFDLLELANQLRLNLLFVLVSAAEESRLFAKTQHIRIPHIVLSKPLKTQRCEQIISDFFSQSKVSNLHEAE
ncbi:MAG: response regulator [Bdellovibrionales bacterium]|nr:response regulator [Bdellovibrionales bacterium]